MVRKSLALDGEGSPFCPRCDAQVVVHDGFLCTSCDYTARQWIDDMTQAALEEADIHAHDVMVLDSPALAITSLSRAERQSALEEASLRG